jgi:programmed cell death protein 5
MDEAAQVEALKKMVMNKLLTKEAAERLGRVKVANPMLASQVEMYLIQIAQSGQVQGQIDDNKLKEILSLLTEKKKTKIVRK